MNNTTTPTDTPTDPPTTSPTVSLPTDSTTSPPNQDTSTTSDPIPTPTTPTTSTPNTSTDESTTSTTGRSPTVTTPPPTLRTTVVTQPGGSTFTEVVTSIQPPVTISGSKVSGSSPSTTETTSLQTGGSGSSKGGLTGGGTIAVAVVVPIVAVALIVLAGIFLWRKRKARKDAEELRRKEVEEYGYNPNNDPTLPPVGTAGSDGPFEMREEGSTGYRGWGTTAVPSSTGRKASTTLSGGQSVGGIGMAYSEGTSATGAISDNRSDQPLVDGSPVSAEGETLGAMGPAASGNRAADINRGPSNASSSYSAANRSDGSGELGGQGGQYYNNQYDAENPYGASDQYGSPPGRSEMPAQPVIRDVQARRNTRIENPSHFPQQSAGISQNF